jgi:hypothetical protein
MTWPSVYRSKPDALIWPLILFNKQLIVNLVQILSTNAFVARLHHRPIVFCSVTRAVEMDAICLLGEIEAAPRIIRLWR